MASNRVHSEKEVTEALRLRITPEFLDTLAESARVVGWSVDFVEVGEFLSCVFEIAGRTRKDALNILPYEYE